MNKKTFIHIPCYFQFYIHDPASGVEIGASGADEIEANKFVVREGLVGVGVSSDYDRIPITVEYRENGFQFPDVEIWDRIVECAVTTRSGKIELIGCVASEGFGVIELPPGQYRLRIHYGGQDKVDSEGNSADYYLIEMWPSDDPSVVVIKKP